MYYSAFDLIFKSDKLHLPELKKVKVNNDIYDVLITQDNHKKWPEIKEGEYDTHFLKMQKNDFRLTILGIAIFRVTKGKNIYWNKLSTEVSESDLKAFLFSSVFGALLIQRNFLLLHGNALIKNKRLIICLGKSGAGKSTISYILMKNGWKLISDDLVAIDDLMNVSIGIQRIKLWQDTLEMFNIENHNLERVRSKINKYIIPKKNLKLANSTSPIYSIFIVYSQDDYLVDPTISDALKIDSEKAKFFLIKDNIFRPRFAKGLQKESLYFKKIISLMKKVPLFLLPIPNNLSKMEDFIIEKFNKNHLT